MATENWWGDDERIQELADALEPHGGRPVRVQGTTGRVGIETPTGVSEECDRIFKSWLKTYGPL